MAKGKERPAAATKTVKSAGTKSPGSRPVQERRPARPSSRVAPDAPASRSAGGPKPGGGMMGASPSPEEVYRMIQETAYFKAKARDFAPGNEVEDWIEAEAEVRRRLEKRAG